MIELTTQLSCLYCCLLWNKYSSSSDEVMDGDQSVQHVNRHVQMKVAEREIDN